MTMKRETKKAHAVQLRNAREHGFTSVRFSSPKLVRAAKADRGHDYMSGPEYGEHRMGRRQASLAMATDRLWARRGYVQRDGGAIVKVTRK